MLHVFCLDNGEGLKLYSSVQKEMLSGKNVPKKPKEKSTMTIQQMEEDNALEGECEAAAKLKKRRSRC
jgi:aryl-alcohol dehydrogenase-like predicted oxidoreductase